MSVSRAAKLFANGVVMSSVMFGWFGSMASVPSEGKSRNISLAKLYGLRSSASDSDGAEMATLLRRSREILINNRTDQDNLDIVSYCTEPAIALEFAHVNISTTIEYDAVTFELQSDFSFDRISPEEDWYDEVDLQGQCGPMQDKCFFETSILAPMTRSLHALPRIFPDTTTRAVILSPIRHCLSSQLESDLLLTCSTKTTMTYHTSMSQPTAFPWDSPRTCVRSTQSPSADSRGKL